MGKSKANVKHNKPANRAQRRNAARILAVSSER